MSEIIFIGILGLLTYTDMKEKRIPNWLLTVALLIRLLCVTAEGNGMGTVAASMFWNGFAVSFPLGMMVFLADKWLGKRTLGGGDIKLLFVTGAYLGWEQNLWVLFLAGVFALLYMAARRKREIPFGPAIALAVVCMMAVNNGMVTG